MYLFIDLNGFILFLDFFYNMFEVLFGERSLILIFNDMGGGELVRIGSFNFVCFVLFFYWCFNKILFFVFRVVVLGDIKDGIKV